jgi:amidase
MGTEPGATPSARAIAEQVRSGRRTARDVLEDCLARIDAADDRIGAFQLVDREGARRAADQLTHATDLPLAGVPVAIKDNIAVAGLPTRHGSGATSAAPEPADDELVRRLRAAGAIVVGKTRLPELAIWGFTESAAHGGTRNPRDLTRNAGGSTGGGAAAVAAGMVPLALGSDGGGSLRIPAANCGVVGLKPARGAVPTAGGHAEHWFGLTAFGPIAATVADAVLAMDVLSAGGEWRSPAAAGSPLRIAVSLRSPSPIGPAGGRARASLRRAAGLAREAGHHVVTRHPPYPRMLLNDWIRPWLAGIAEDAEQLGLRAADVEPRTRSAIARGARLRRRGGPGRGPADRWRRGAQDWFADVDVLLTPVVARAAPVAGWAERAGYVRSYLDSARRVPFTQPWNLAGFTAMSLPIGASGAVQLVAAPGREAALLQLAEELENNHG